MVWQRSRSALEFMIIEGHDVEKESQMVGAMQSSQVWAAYLALRLPLRQKASMPRLSRGNANEPSLS